MKNILFIMEGLLGISIDFLREYKEMVGDKITESDLQEISADTINQFIAKWQLTLRSLELGTTFSVKESPSNIIETKVGVLAILDYAREITEKKIKLIERHLSN